MQGIARPASYRRSQRVSAAAMNSPAPINKASAIPPRTERTWWRRLAGLVLAAAVCAAKRPIQKLLMHQPCESCRNIQNLPRPVSQLCEFAHMNSSGMPAHPHKHGIKVASWFDRMLILHALKNHWD